MKRIAVIVEALSTGFNLVQDCLDRDIEPVILETLREDSENYEIIQEEREQKYRRLPKKIQILREDPSYENTLQMIKALDPMIVLPGAEDGVILATRLADDLGLKGNPYSLIDKMTNKFYMHKALNEAGVRCIRGRVVKTAEEAASYYDELNTEKVVVKPPHGAASMGVRFCNSKEELVKIFNEQVNHVGILGDVTTELLIQERIIGSEYIVNTITIEGKHQVASIWKYEKRALANGSNVYVGVEAVACVSPEIYMLTRYAFSVLDAIGIKHGPVHGEYILDEHGPVLVEVNCRCMGGSYPMDYGNQVFGHHETDLALDSYVEPEKVRKKLSRPYKLKKYAMSKLIVTPHDMSIANSPVIGIIPFLSGFHTCMINTSATVDTLQKTVDLETNAGMIYMLHDDYSVLKKEYNLLHTIEDQYFGLLYQKSYDADLGSLPEIKFAPESQDCMTITQERLKDYPLEDVYQYFKDIIKAVKPGGKVIVKKEVYDDFPYGLAGMVMIFEIMNLDILLPEYNDDSLMMQKKAD